jgi:hypothetical protein
MSAPMSAAIDAEMRAAAALIDPVERITIVTDFFAAIDGALEPIARVGLTPSQSFGRRGCPTTELRSSPG